MKYIKHIGLPELIIRMQSAGCRNRRVHPIVVMKTLDIRDDKPIEQLGMYDPVRNHYGERVVSLNMDRIRYWLCKGALPSRKVASLFGLAGITAVTDHTRMEAIRNTEKQIQYDSGDELKDDSVR